MAESCNGCRYWRVFTGRGEYACHYCLDNDEPRGCPAAECTHYTRNEPQIGDEDIRRHRFGEKIEPWLYRGYDQYLTNPICKKRRKR